MRSSQSQHPGVGRNGRRQDFVAGRALLFRAGRRAIDHDRRRGGAPSFPASRDLTGSAPAERRGSGRGDRAGPRSQRPQDAPRPDHRGGGPRWRGPRHVAGHEHRPRRLFVDGARELSPGSSFSTRNDGVDVGCGAARVPRPRADRRRARPHRAHESDAERLPGGGPSVRGRGSSLRDGRVGRHLRVAPGSPSWVRGLRHTPFNPADARGTRRTDRSSRVLSGVLGARRRVGARGPRSMACDRRGAIPGLARGRILARAGTPAWQPNGVIDVRPDGAWAAAISVVALLVLAISLAVRGGRMTTRRMAVSPFGPRRVRHAPPGRARGPGLRVWAIGRFAPAPLGAALGWVLAGPMGAVVGGGAGAAVPLIRARRESRTRAEGLERDLADLASTTGLALRSGLSVSQALEYAGSELPFPTRELFERFLEQRRLGVPFEPALSEFGAALGTDDAQLFVLVMGVHARSGGDLAGALDEVATTIRHRVAVRRELRAASTQGR